MNIKEKAARMKAVSPFMAASSEEVRNRALRGVADAIAAAKADILEENRKDLEAAERKGISAPVLKRLKFGEDKIRDVLDGIEELIGLPDPLNRITLASRPAPSASSASSLRRVRTRWSRWLPCA